jgi:hypothetical protein
MVRRWKGGNRNECVLIGEVKLTEFGAASPSLPLSKEDERSAALAARAQRGDYDDGMHQLSTSLCRNS